MGRFVVQQESYFFQELKRIHLDDGGQADVYKRQAAYNQQECGGRTFSNRREMGAEDSGADFDSTCLSEDIASGGWLLRLSGQLLPVGGTGCRRKDHYPGPVYGLSLIHIYHACRCCS